MSRALVGEPPLTRARLALPGVTSTSTKVGRGLPASSSRITRARTTALVVPARTSAASVGTRWLPRVATYPSASTRLVLPCPFGPTSAVMPGSSGSSTWAYDRKSVRDRWATYICCSGGRWHSGARRRLGGGPRARGPGRLQGVTAELLTQRRDGLHRRRLLLPGREAREQRGRDHR